MKQALLTTIQKAFPGNDFLEISETQFSGNIGIDQWIDVGYVAGTLYIKAPHREIFRGAIPTENGQPDWDFIRKVLVNWKSF